MKRFLCAAFFMALVVLFAACGALNSSTAASAATATPTSSTSRTQKSEPVQVKENPAKVDVVGEQAATAPTATAAPAQTPRDRGFPGDVSGRCDRADPDLFGRTFNAS